MDSDWSAAILWFAGACLFWVVMLMTPVGRTLLELVLRINSIGM